MDRKTKETIVDMAWGTDGLVEQMRRNGDPGANALDDARMFAFTLSEGDSDASARACYRIMETLARKHNYDSLKRKYAKPASTE